MLCLAEKIQIKKSLLRSFKISKNEAGIKEEDRDVLKRVFVYLGIDLNEEEQKMLEG